eukprot:PhM_4_TR9101/c0_g1_i1/m.80651
MRRSLCEAESSPKPMMMRSTIWCCQCKKVRSFEKSVFGRTVTFGASGRGSRGIAAACARRGGALPDEADADRDRASSGCRMSSCAARGTTGGTAAFGDASPPPPPLIALCAVTASLSALPSDKKRGSSSSSRTCPYSAAHVRWYSEKRRYGPSSAGRAPRSRAAMAETVSDVAPSSHTSTSRPCVVAPMCSAGGARGFHGGTVWCSSAGVDMDSVCASRLCVTRTTTFDVVVSGSVPSAVVVVTTASTRGHHVVFFASAGGSLIAAGDVDWRTWDMTEGFRMPSATTSAPPLHVRRYDVGVDVDAAEVMSPPFRYKYSSGVS